MDDSAVGRPDEDRALSRREALKRGAVLGGAALWATPAVQVLAMSESAAESPSGLSDAPGKARPRGPAKGRPFF